MSEQLLIRLDAELKSKLRRLARAEGKTSSQMVRELIGEYVKDRDIAGYIAGLWDRTGRKLREKGVKPADVDQAVAEVRTGRR
jgi:predicted transcriptional regulator